MPDLDVLVSLEAGGVAAVLVQATLHRYTPAERARRAGGILLLALVLAASLLPIPIIHFIGPPFILVTGAVLAVRQLRAGARLAPTRVACPKCGGENRIGGGIGVADPGRETTRLCEHCRRVLTLRLLPATAGGSPVAG